MPDRDIAGDIRRVGLNRLPEALGIDGDALKAIAERVRQFDDAQSNETRQRKAVERIAAGLTPEDKRDRLQREERERRHVRAAELLALATAYPIGELRDTEGFRSMLYRFTTTNT